MSIEEMRNLLESVSSTRGPSCLCARAHPGCCFRQVGGLFGFSSSLQDVSSLHALLDVDNSKSVSWQEWSHACAVWLLEMGQ